MIKAQGLRTGYCFLDIFNIFSIASLSFHKNHLS